MVVIKMRIPTGLGATKPVEITNLTVWRTSRVATDFVERSKKVKGRTRGSIMSCGRVEWTPNCNEITIVVVEIKDRIICCVFSERLPTKIVRLIDLGSEG